MFLLMLQELLYKQFFFNPHSEDIQKFIAKVQRTTA